MPVAELSKTRMPSRLEIGRRIGPILIMDDGQPVARRFISLISGCADRDMNGPQVVKALNNAILTMVEVDKIRSTGFRPITSPERTGHSWDILRWLIYALIDDQPVREEAISSIYNARWSFHG